MASTGREWAEIEPTDRKGLPSWYVDRSLSSVSDRTQFFPSIKINLTII